MKNKPNPSHWNRRDFLRAAGAVAAGASLQPFAWGKAWKDDDPAAEPTLILVELKGGNDGLSTVIPLRDPMYTKFRKSALVHPSESLVLDAEHGLNSQMSRLATAFHQGRVAIVEGVGLPNGVRSHFKATDIWHSADPQRGAASPGWIARLGDMAWPERGNDAVVHMGDSPLRAHFSSTRSPLAVLNPDHFTKIGPGPNGFKKEASGSKKSKSAQAKREKSSGNPALDRIRRISQEADRQSQRIRVATAGYRTPVEYPNSTLGQNLRDMAAVLHFPDGSTPRVLSTTLGGFDTHARQKRAHDRNMGLVDAALAALLKDLERSAIGRRAVVLVYSEFGRRVNENGSQGTDHGKAGPVFLLGHKISGGMYGQVPKLDNLDSGDLRVTTDFRSIYATLVENLFGQDSQALFGQAFPKLSMLG